jgi:hypothetical protein
MRLSDLGTDPRTRIAALLRAGLLAGVGLAIVPLPAAAASANGDAGQTTEVRFAATTTSGSVSVPAADDATPSPSPTPDPSPTPTPTPDPSPTPTPSPTPSPSPTPIVLKVFIYQSSGVARQYKKNWCVAAVVQTMQNLVKGTANTTLAWQKSAYSLIHKHNRYTYKTHGNDVQGWAYAMKAYTGQPYTARSFVHKNDAIAAIAEALDRTGHPVGITVEHGRHAWIVLGYRASVAADDATKKTLLGFYVSGPLGPGSSDPWKYEYFSMARFRAHFGYYHEWQRKVIWEHQYVVVTD